MIRRADIMLKKICWKDGAAETAFNIGEDLIDAGADPKLRVDLVRFSQVGKKFIDQSIVHIT